MLLTQPAEELTYCWGEGRFRKESSGSTGLAEKVIGQMTFSANPIYAMYRAQGDVEDVVPWT